MATVDRTNIPYIDNCMRCGVRLSAHTGQVIIIVQTVVGTDETILCALDYDELVGPMSQIEIVRCGRSIDLST